MKRPHRTDASPVSDENPREVLTFAVPPKQGRVRLDVYLAHQVENATRNKVRQAIEEGWVLVDGKQVKPAHQVGLGK